MLAALDLAGNPSSVHGAGRAARRMLEDAREAVAARFGARPRMSSSPPAGPRPMRWPSTAWPRGRRILVGATEHDAVSPPRRARRCCRSARRHARPRGAGRRAGRGRPALVCLMAANNETGVMHPWPRRPRSAVPHGALLHVDAVQAAGPRAGAR